MPAVKAQVKNQSDKSFDDLRVGHRPMNDLLTTDRDLLPSGPGFTPEGVLS